MSDDPTNWYYVSGRDGLALYLQHHPLARSVWFQTLWSHLVFMGIGVLVGMDADREQGLTMMTASLGLAIAVYVMIWARSLYLAACARCEVENALYTAVCRIIFEAGEEGR